MRKKIQRNIKRLIWKVKSVHSTNKMHLFDLGQGLKVEYPLSTAIGFALFSHNFETTELAFVRQYLKPGQTFFDIGANGGIFTVTGAQCVGNDGHVFAFEPGEYECTLLKQNVRLNKLNNVTIIKKAVSNSDGIQDFATAQDGAFNSLAQTDHPEQQIENWLKVKTVTLDSFTRKNGIKSVDFIKVDVEGAEKLVFEGAKQLLQNNPNVCILFEAYELNTRGFGYTAQSFLEDLQRDGFHLFFFKNAAHLYPIDNFQEEFGGESIQNFIATRTPKQFIDHRL